ncbi:hypothetical protein CO083_05780 [Candidatus Roizmanbacteria bacterium CG_4_9_14_0_8_um_filter_34_12]|uniref:Inositol monophosphatase n=4 Tax=Candidatus Roizmaniibacteriota TaxID=1752723 RepID=A0A2M7E4E8_9BACT|nr:MAG: hypothetical protein COW96_05350 [Candidatus Roizmanbacteria bacterium CG22_combo_CG10-13_8_21_14_all_33_16]PIV62617.1 MAG: hypothetical protein COS12_01665 [Candidatus Roizmanbacteria bacterium CG01_land_8_20_14_3_00_33_9]PIX70663.1 MAG: hypothetical protein COZ39_04375 [Candidatus Roizmanbacteria bacterium CG_4_10_14_3_um_filter_33_21]PJB87673.1 MAG: hypothetical protein CO083_05780 [Candidatus Roizmanbacteria bacterium CG_4_9_14_0_8_um_filter_34_12]
MDNYLQFAKKLALTAGGIMLTYFKQGVEFTVKKDKSIVTEADIKINQMVIDQITKIYPVHSILGEEKTQDNRSDFAWVCDPIDGTVPFSKGIPISVFSLALVKNGEPQLGVVYDPFMKRMYSAVKGEGAFLDDRLIMVSDIRAKIGATINVEWWFSAQYDISRQMYQFSLDTNTDMYQIGSVTAASCLVASGQLEAVVFAGGKGKNVDIAAVKVIVEEAGGVVTDLFGSDQRYDDDIKGAVLANKKIHQTIISYTQDLKKV